MLNRGRIQNHIFAASKLTKSVRFDAKANRQYYYRFKHRSTMTDFEKPLCYNPISADEFACSEMTRSANVHANREAQELFCQVYGSVNESCASQS